MLQGLLRGAMLTFFASASDFTRRLTSVEANAKFSRLDAGPEEDWESTPADLRGVVSHIKQRCVLGGGGGEWRGGGRVSIYLGG
jgi:raffinose synthase